MVPTICQNSAKVISQFGALESLHFAVPGKGNHVHCNKFVSSSNRAPWNWQTNSINCRKCHSRQLSSQSTLVLSGAATRGLNYYFRNSTIYKNACFNNSFNSRTWWRNLCTSQNSVFHSKVLVKHAYFEKKRIQNHNFLWSFTKITTFQAKITEISK